MNELTEYKDQILILAATITGFNKDVEVCNFFVENGTRISVPNFLLELLSDEPSLDLWFNNNSGNQELLKNIIHHLTIIIDFIRSNCYLEMIDNETNRDVTESIEYLSGVFN